MAIEKENACNGCEVCLRCGRGGNYKVFLCDSCGEQITETVFFVGSQHVCDDCLPEVIPHCDVEDCFDEEDYFDE